MDFCYIRASSRGVIEFLRTERSEEAVSELKKKAFEIAEEIRCLFS